MSAPDIKRNPMIEKSGVKGGKKFCAAKGTTREKIYSSIGRSTPRIDNIKNPHHTIFLFLLTLTMRYMINSIKRIDIKSCPPGSAIVGRVIILNKIIKPMYAEKSILTVSIFFIHKV